MEPLERTDRAAVDAGATRMFMVTRRLVESASVASLDPAASLLEQRQGAVVSGFASGIMSSQDVPVLDDVEGMCFLSSSWVWAILTV